MDEVIALVERANQRGGRMLSVVDLLEAGTLSPARAAWLTVRIEEGSSFLVGARPGGAGKTAVMGALLTMLPGGRGPRLANAGTGWEGSAPGECVVAYELSPGSYDAYLWGEDVRRLARLAAGGCQVVSNLHADTLAEAREQVVGQNGASEEEFGAFALFLPLIHRKLRAVHQYRAGRWHELTGEPELSAREKAVAAFLVGCREDGRRTIREVRGRWLRWREDHPAEPGG